MRIARALLTLAVLIPLAVGLAAFYRLRTAETRISRNTATPAPAESNITRNVRMPARVLLRGLQWEVKLVPAEDYRARLQCDGRVISINAYDPDPVAVLALVASHIDACEPTLDPAIAPSSTTFYPGGQ